MDSLQKVYRRWPVALLMISILSGTGVLLGQAEQKATIERHTLLVAAHDVMTGASNCVLVTLDSAGQPHARIMDPFPPENDMVVWLATNPLSRKVREIQDDPRVTLLYVIPEGGGYVTLEGTAMIVDDPEEKSTRWKEGWESFYVDRDQNYTLIRVSPAKLDVLSFKHSITGDPETWKTPSIIF